MPYNQELERFLNDSDKQAYALYYDELYESDKVLSYNGFYGSDIHKKYLVKLRKEKLEEIKKVSE